MVKSGTGSSQSVPRGQPSFLRGMPSSLKIVVALAAAVLHSSSASSSAAVPDTYTPTGTISSASGVVAVNEGLLVTGSVHFGAVPVPNLCVELRGYQTAAAAEDEPSASSTKAGDGSGAGPAAAAAATAAGGRAWRGWGEGEPRFLQLGRTGASDGSFTFVTPESGMMLVLAAYSHDGDHPAAVRVFPDDDAGSSSGVDQGTAARQVGGGGGGVGGGGAPAFGVGSGRVEVHIDLLAEGKVHAPEELWSRATADRADDRSPCARREAADARSGGGGADATAAAAAAAGSGSGSGAAMANPDDPPAAPKPESFLTVDRAMTALMALGRSSYAGLSQLGAGLWKASAGACAALFSGLKTAGKFFHESSAVESPSLSSRLLTWLEQTSAQFRSCSQQRSDSLSAWFGQRSTQFSAWFDRKSSVFSAGFDQHLPQFALLWWRKAWAWLSPHLEQYDPFEPGAWWAVWWVRVVCIALLLGVLQQAFCLITRASSTPTGVDRDDSETVVDTPGCESPHQDQGTAGSDSMVATVHNADGTVSKLDFAKLDRPAEPATIEKKRRGILASMWGGGGRSGSTEETQGGQGKEEGADEFSSMFRALSQPACNASAPTTGGAGGASNFVVVTQQSWAQEAGDSRDY